jgi:prepilin-type N-terminal cleavage/methylation domain-containing protein
MFLATKSRLKAFTLIEAVIAMAVVSLLLGAIYLSLIYGSRSLQQTLAYSDVQRQAQMAMRRLKDDLGGSSFAKVAPGLNEVRLISPHGTATESDADQYRYTGVGQLLFRTWVGYYKTPTGELRRAEINLSPDIVLPDPVAIPLLADFQAVSGPLVRTVGRHLDSFSVAPNAAVQTLTISLSVRREVNSSRSTELSLTSQVRARH